MDGNNMTREEKENLVEKVADMAMRDVLNREDMILILAVCKEACDRRIEEIENGLPTPVGRIQ